MSAALLSTVFLSAAEGGEGEEEPAIEIGHHVERSIGPLTFNLDTIWTTLLAVVLVLALGFIARRALTRNTEDHVPTKVQLIWESIVGEVNKQVNDNLGARAPLRHAAGDLAVLLHPVLQLDRAAADRDQRPGDRT